MAALDLRAHTTARLLAGRPLPLLGRLLADTREDGTVVPLDPDTGAELRADDGDLLPAFVLSTENEATDGHIVRQHWDLSRGMDEGGPGVPVLYNHTLTHVGQWHQLGVRTLRDGPALVGRPRLMPYGEAARLELAAQIRDGFLRSVSVGWDPGESIRRGELDPADPLYREALDGPCGPEEGMIMGTEAGPNRLFETSFTPLPADAHAQQWAEGRLRARAGTALAAFHEGRSTPADMDAVLALFAADPRVRAWAERLVRGVLAAESAPTPAPTRSAPAPARPRTLAALLKTP